MRFPIGARLAVMIATFSCAALAEADGGIAYVDDDAAAGGKGTSWETAWRHLQDALGDRSDACEIRVAGGLYRPDRSNANPSGTGDRSASFNLLDGVALRGGYRGALDGSGLDPDDRDVVLFTTVLSGDLAGNDGESFENYDDNSNHVVRVADDVAAATIDGFVIRGGNANSMPYDICGAGIHSGQQTPITVQDCTLIGNRAESIGGGMFLEGGGEGDGWIVVNCRFVGNDAGGGGAIGGLAFDAVVSNCLFSANSADVLGGAMAFLGNSTITGCTFSGNSAGSRGGAIAIISTFAFFTASLDNSILWGNTSPLGAQISAETTQNDQSQPLLAVSYCNVQGGEPAVYESFFGHVFWSDGNIDENPLFLDADGADSLPGTEDDDLRLRAGSPCADSGNNDAVPPDHADLDEDGDTDEAVPVDLDSNPRFVDDPDAPDSGIGDPSVTDMGAFEFCRGDTNRDGEVGVQDLIDVALAWGSNDVDADANGDSVVDVSDLITVIVNWGPCE